ncbi:MAG: MlaD family protein [Pseudonocardiaceae bacterium]
MLVRRTKIQLIAFVVIATVAIVYSLFRFTDIGRVFGQSGYIVTLKMEDSGGIFSNAEVTYRGFNVGRVGEMSLTDTGLQADLEIEPDHEHIPADLVAVIGNRSAIGEQYVDLRPRTDEGPFLEEGSVIPEQRVETPVRAFEAIKDLHDIAQSVPIDALSTIVDESYKAFSGTGDDLQVLMDTSRDFVAAAQQNLPATVELLRSGNKVLDAQNAEADSLKSFARDLRLVSEQLKTSDLDLRKLIEVTPRSATQISEVLRETGPGLSSLIANLLTLSNLQVDRLDGLEQALISYPILAAGADAVLTEEGKARLGFVLNLFDPPPCTRGYEGTEKRPGDALTDVPPNNQAYCAEPQGSPIDVRGSQNAPFNGAPVQPSEQQVAANSDRDQESLREWRERQAAGGGSGLTLNSLAALLGLPG